MELKKIFVILMLACFHNIYAQYFDMEPFSLEDESLKIEEESVVFSAATLIATIKINNTNNERVSVKPTIKCVPLPHGGGSYSLTLIPDDFQMFDNGKKMDFLISYRNRYYSVAESQKESAYEPSYIHFSLAFNPHESKTIIIKYKNDSDYYRSAGNIYAEKTVSYIFNTKSNKKTVFYPPISDSYIFLVDFLFIQNESYSMANNLSRIYKNDDFLWMLEVPNNIYEVFCRQTYFHPFADGSAYLFRYKACFSDLDEELLFKFNEKNLSKELLSKSDLFTLSKRQLSILRNSFYAKHGYNFKNKEVREYFEANCRHQGVEYKVNPNFSESDFNEIERKNIALIREMESMKTPMKFSECISE